MIKILTKYREVIINGTLTYNNILTNKYLAILKLTQQMKIWIFSVINDNLILISFMKNWLSWIIVIIMSCGQHGHPWPSLSTSPYHSSPLAGLQGYIPYHHIAAECMFEMVVLLLIGHMRGSTGVHHLRAHLSVGHGYLSMAVFILIYRSHSYRWAAVDPYHE